MNYYPAMNHHMLPEVPFRYPPPNFTNLPHSTTNRFIYVKHNFLNQVPPPAPKVLVNPHFKKKVFVNPQFKLPSTLPVVKPKIHVNPNILKNFGKTVPNTEPHIKPVVETKPVTVISTRNKLVRIPCNSTNTVVRKRRNSVHTKYKIVRSSSGAKTPNKFRLDKTRNQFKLDKRDKTANKLIARPIRKKYVYVNRFLSMDVMAKNVLLKKNINLCKPGFVNINGILYKKSPNSLKRASETSQSSFRKNVLTSSKYKLVRKDAKHVNSARRNLVKRHKLIRSTKHSLNKMRKCNIPCPIFRKYGKCPGKASGKCFKVHNPDQIVLCTRFLQGACHNENCLLSHKVSLEKMPTCKYFLDGLCSKDNCPYLHVKISPKADICRDFLEGFCKKGAECDKRHQFLCPDFEKNRKCDKRRCPYPHGNVVRKNTKVLNMLAKKCSAKKKKVVKVKDLSEKNRYYKDLKESLGEQSVINTVSRDRPKLGQLPAFIPFFEGS